MATTISSNVLEEFSARVQTEGRKLAGRVRDDITALIGRNPQVVLDDVRKRATAAAKELDAQRERLSALLAPLGKLASQVITRSGIASANEVADLKRRVEELERRSSRSKAA